MEKLYEGKDWEWRTDPKGHRYRHIFKYDEYFYYDEKGWRHVDYEKLFGPRETWPEELRDDKRWKTDTWERDHPEQPEDWMEWVD